jgi:hypothetical protein
MNTPKKCLVIISTLIATAPAIASHRNQQTTLPDRPVDKAVACLIGNAAVSLHGQFGSKAPTNIVDIAMQDASKQCPGAWALITDGGEDYIYHSVAAMANRWFGAQDLTETGHAGPSQTRQTLLERISDGRWCASKKSYSLNYGGDNIIWTDNLGNVDVEDIVSNADDEAHTRTRKSGHWDNRNVPIGTMWSYWMTGRDQVQVGSSTGSQFHLTRC